MRHSQRLGWIGVDVGTHTVKLAQTVREADRVRLHRAAVIQRPAAWSGDDGLALEQPRSSCAELRSALECASFSGRDAVCALPMNICQLRFLKVPPGSDHERRTIIGNELAEEWANRRSPMEFDFWEMELGPGDKLSDSFNVSVLGASRQWISQIWRDCRDGGLDCWAVDGAPLTIARAVAMVGGVSGSRRALAVDWGFSNTTLCVVGDGRPLYSRRVHDCAFGRVLDAIMNTFDVTLDEAQHLTETQGMLRPKDEPTPAAHSHQFDPSVVSDADLPFAIAADPAIQAAITDSSAPAVEELVRQIRRTLQFTEAQRRHLHPAAVWLLGGGAAMRNVAPYLSHALHVPVRVWNLAPEAEPIACAAGSRSALFAGAAALSAAAWRAA